MTGLKIFRPHDSDLRRFLSGGSDPYNFGSRLVRNVFDRTVARSMNDEYVGPRDLLEEWVYGRGDDRDD